METIFAPFGVTEYFFKKGYNNTLLMPKFLKEIGLTGYEYSFSEGIHISDDGAKTLKNEADKNKIKLSSYLGKLYNISSDNEKEREIAEEFLFKCVETSEKIGSERLVIPLGNCAITKRSDVFSRSVKSMKTALNYSDNIFICPETMGLIHDFGTLQEVIKICQENERFIPALNFPNIFSRNSGQQIDFKIAQNIFKEIEKKLGRYRAENVHIYLSNVYFTNQGYKKYADFSEDTGFDFNYKPVIDAIKKENLTPFIVCRSPDNPYLDMINIKKYFLKEI